MTPQRINLVTLGVDDLTRSRAFYAALGWTETSWTEGVVFYQMAGMALGLFGKAALAEDQGRAGTTLETGAITLAQNFTTAEDVDHAFAQAVAAGATSLKTPEAVFWGGYSGYFADPDGHVWELAHNPFWTVEADGTITIPPME